MPPTVLPRARRCRRAAAARRPRLHLPAVAHLPQRHDAQAAGASSIVDLKRGCLCSCFRLLLQNIYSGVTPKRFSNAPKLRKPPAFGSRWTQLTHTHTRAGAAGARGRHAAGRQHRRRRREDAQRLGRGVLLLRRRQRHRQQWVAVAGCWGGRVLHFFRSDAVGRSAPKCKFAVSAHAVSFATDTRWGLTLLPPFSRHPQAAFCRTSRALPRTSTPSAGASQVSGGGGGEGAMAQPACCVGGCCGAPGAQRLLLHSRCCRVYAEGWACAMMPALLAHCMLGTGPAEVKRTQVTPSPPTHAYTHTHTHSQRAHRPC